MPYEVLTPFNQNGFDAKGGAVVRDDETNDWGHGTVGRRVENGFLRVITEDEALDIEVANGTADAKRLKAREAAEKARAKAEADAKAEAEELAKKEAAEKAKADADAKAKADADSGKGAGK